MIKRIIKNIIRQSYILKAPFIFFYKLTGRKPWSAGYSFYKYAFVKDIISHHLDFFGKGALPQGYGTGLDERAVEYPWVFSRIKKEERVILDAGSSLNHRDILSLSCLQERTVYLTTLFYEGQCKSRGNVIYQYEDLRELSFSDDYFDAVICISTLEHVGMDNTYYSGTDEQKREDAPSAYLQAIQELKRVLRKGGSLYLTVPYGAYQHHQWFQIFDAEMIGRLKKEFLPAQVSETYFKYENKQWNYSDEASCKKGYYFDIHKERQLSQDHLAAAQSVVCLELKK